MYQQLYDMSNYRVDNNPVSETRPKHQIQHKQQEQQRKQQQISDATLPPSTSLISSIITSIAPQSSSSSYLLFQSLSSFSNRYRELIVPLSSSSCTSASSSSSSLRIIMPHVVNFLPDFTEHPKPQPTIRHSKSNVSKTSGIDPLTIPPPSQDDEDEETNEITFFHDFIAGGVAGTMSVIVGHPFDTVKVRMQTSTNLSGNGILSALSPEFGGISSLFRGISAPLYTAALVNAIVFGSYGLSSRVYSSYYNNTITNDPSDQAQQLTTTTYRIETDVNNVNSNVMENRDNDNDDSIDDTIKAMVQTHDPWQKAMICGAFAGLVQCTVICPMEHVKCRLQTQSSCSTSYYKSPYDAVKTIVSKYGIRRLYQGWWTTCFREVPACGLYFASYDYLKDIANIYIARNMDVVQTNPNNISCTEHSHTWVASAFAGGCAGCLTWGLVYPIDVIKTVIQTSSLTTPHSELNMYRIGYNLYKLYGMQHLFRGLSIALIRAFPVNGTIFPVYEFTLKFVCTYIDK